LATAKLTGPGPLWKPGDVLWDASPGCIGYGQRMVYDFRHKSESGQWKSHGHRKGETRDAAFAALEQKNGPMPSGRYMSRPRDGRTKNWDLFTRP
jgi:hypothetical protein